MTTIYVYYSAAKLLWVAYTAAPETDSVYGFSRIEAIRASRANAGHPFDYRIVDLA